MAEVLVQVVVVDEGLYIGNGLVARWLDRLSNNLYHNIVAEAPQRTGNLKSEIDVSRSRVGRRTIDCQVESHAPYSVFVIEGTTGPIYSDGGWDNLDLVEAMLGGERVDEDTHGLWMHIDDGGPRFHLAVSGQRANNFMQAGYDRTSRTHRALHPFFPGITPTRFI